MSKAARVESIDAIRLFRASLLTFAEKANVALGEAESEVQRVMGWLENEQTQHWTSELRKRTEAVAKAKDALRFKQVFKSQTGARQSTVDEEKVLAIAERRLAEAQQKMTNTKRWMRQLQKEAHVYRGTVQRLSTTVQVDLPTAAGKMDRMIQSLESYVALNAPSIDFGSEGAAGSAGVSRGSGVIPEAGGAYKDLRKSTPPPSDRAGAPAAEPSAAPWPNGELAPGDAEALAKVPLDRQPIDGSAMVVLAATVDKARRVYFERLDPAFGGDSGWYIGPADATDVPGFVAVRLEQLLAARPVFGDLLSLPAGALAIMDAAGIAAVLNGQDEDVWQK